jgi:hypothetical protein
MTIIYNNGTEIELITLVDGSSWPAGDWHAQRALKDNVSRAEGKERNRQDYAIGMYQIAASRGFRQSSWP